jgi:hypothetical protein
MNLALQPIRGHDPQKIMDWLIALGTLCSTARIDQSHLEVILPAYVVAAMEDLPPRAFSITSLRAARRHFTRWPPYAEIYQWFADWLPENPAFNPDYFYPNDASTVSALPEPEPHTKEFASWRSANVYGHVDHPPGPQKPELR